MTGVQHWIPTKPDYGKTQLPQNPTPTKTHHRGNDAEHCNMFLQHLIAITLRYCLNLQWLRLTAADTQVVVPQAGLKHAFNLTRCRSSPTQCLVIKLRAYDKSGACEQDCAVSNSVLVYKRLVDVANVEL